VLKVWLSESGATPLTTVLTAGVRSSISVEQVASLYSLWVIVPPAVTVAPGDMCGVMGSSADGEWSGRHDDRGHGRVVQDRVDLDLPLLEATVTRASRPGGRTPLAVKHEIGGARGVAVCTPGRNRDAGPSSESGSAGHRDATPGSRPTTSAGAAKHHEAMRRARLGSRALLS